VDWWTGSKDVAAQGRFEEYQALLALVAQLPKDRRTAFALTQIERMPYAEAAEIIGAPIGTVRSRVARGRRDLVRMLRQKV
jgi:RNA polymerase sigma-70 factor (ECF subfamily)